MADLPPLDTRIQIVTPENIAFQYRIAGPFRRLPAYLVDVLLRIGLILIVSFSLLLAFGSLGLGGLGAGAAMIAWFLLDWFYGGLFETFWNGQTPGKRMLRIRVVSVEGQPINGMQAVLRNLLRSVDAFPVIGALPTYLLGLTAATMNDRFQRLGDLASGTMVIVEDPQHHYGMARIKEPEAVRLAADLPPQFRVSRSLARALSSYVQRRDTFAWRKRADIARYVGEPLRIKFGLPPGTSHDLLLCALYHRTFVAERATESGQNPFMPPRPAPDPQPIAVKAP